MFADRLINDEDRSWFTTLLQGKMKTDFGVEMSDVVTSDPLLYCDFATENYEARPYVEVLDHAQVSSFFNWQLSQQLVSTVSNLNLLLFYTDFVYRFINYLIAINSVQIVC